MLRSRLSSAQENPEGGALHKRVAFLVIIQTKNIFLTSKIAFLWYNVSVLTRKGVSAMLTRNLVSPRNFFVDLTQFVFTLFEALLGLRFIFKLFAANTTAPFVRWLYETSDVLISPFRGIFQSPVIEGRFVFDVTALVAIIIYGLIASLIIYLFNLTLPHQEVVTRS